IGVVSRITRGARASRRRCSPRRWEPCGAGFLLSGASHRGKSALGDEAHGGAEWTGMRSFSAQNNLRAMKRGEQAFFYHTGKERAIVGIVKVVAEAHPDSTDAEWSAVNGAAGGPPPSPVGLDQIKADRRLAGMALVRIS